MSGIYWTSTTARAINSAVRKFVPEMNVVSMSAQALLVRRGFPKIGSFRNPCCLACVSWTASGSSVGKMLDYLLPSPVPRHSRAALINVSISAGRINAYELYRQEWAGGPSFGLFLSDLRS